MGSQSINVKNVTCMGNRVSGRAVRLNGSGGRCDGTVEHDMGYHDAEITLWAIGEAS